VGSQSNNGEEDAEAEAVCLTMCDHVWRWLMMCAGVAVGPNLVQWVHGLQHLATQQQELKAQHTAVKAARKKDKVRWGRLLPAGYGYREGMQPGCAVAI